MESSSQDHNREIDHSGRGSRMRGKNDRSESSNQIYELRQHPWDERENYDRHGDHESDWHGSENPDADSYGRPAHVSSLSGPFGSALAHSSTAPEIPTRRRRRSTLMSAGHSLRRRSVRQSQQRAESILPAAAAAAMSEEVPQVQNINATAEEIYILTICRTLMMYGAATHRLEEYMHRTAQVLDLHVQSFYMPGCMIISFNEGTVWRSNEVHIVRCTQSLNLTKLDDVHTVYKDIIHDKLGIEEATTRLYEILNRKDEFPPWVRVLMYGLASACIGPVSYGARPVDLPIIFLLGSLLGFMELMLAARSELYAHIFEISSTILCSFLARAFGSIPYPGGSGTGKRIFCFSAISQASLVMILPGFTITNSALELQSKNIVSGSVRMVYGVIFTLFLGFGFTVGTTIYGAFDSNATSATTCETTWPFWWQVIFVAPFTLFWVLINNEGNWKKMPAMLVISLIGWLVNHFSAQRFAANAQIAQALGSLTVGVLANLLSRLGYSLAVAVLHPAIFIQVPGSLAASGSLISGVKNADQLTNHVGTGTSTSGNNSTGAGAASGVQVNTAVLTAGYAMIEIAIGITVGLSVSALVVYPLRKKGRKSGLFSF